MGGSREGERQRAAQLVQYVAGDRHTQRLRVAQQRAADAAIVFAPAPATATPAATTATIAAAIGSFILFARATDAAAGVNTTTATGVDGGAMTLELLRPERVQMT